MSEDKTRGITGISVTGFKSLKEETHIDIRPLTILAGANSSGKSSIMQPLLLMKQTLEASYDPGTFLLDGPNVQFTDISQFANRDSLLELKRSIDEFEFEAELASGFAITPSFASGMELNLFYVLLSIKGFRTQQILPGIAYRRGGRFIGLRERTPHDLLEEIFGTKIEEIRQYVERLANVQSSILQIQRERCFLNLQLIADNENIFNLADSYLDVSPFREQKHFVDMLNGLIHVPGIRKQPERVYNVSSQQNVNFEGLFDRYVASIITSWQAEEDMRLAKLTNNVVKLGLTSNISAQQLNNAQIEIQVGRTLQSTKEDMVNIADVGFGVSQVLPVLVALLVAQPGQLVYIEQPELHLHPRAQVKLASIIAEASKRGVRVVIETHSSLLLIGIQTLIAEGNLSPDDVVLHWFTLKEDGTTQVTSQVPDANGAYGEWPEDFADVELQASQRYLDAVMDRSQRSNGGKAQPETTGD